MDTDRLIPIELAEELMRQHGESEYARGLKDGSAQLDRGNE